MYIASLTGVEIASRLPVISAEPNALRRIAQPPLDRMYAHHDAVGAFTLLAHLHEARDRDIPGRVLQDRVRDARGAQRRGRKADADGRDAKQDRECDRPRTGEERRDDEHGNERQRCPERGLACGGEIENDAEAERDRKPRQQTPGRRIGREPAREDFARAAERVARLPRDAAGPRDIPRARPPRSPAELRHGTQPQTRSCYCRFRVRCSVNRRGTRNYFWMTLA